MIQPKEVESKSSALNAKIHVTVFSDRRATKMKEHAISLRELGDRISNKPSRSKEQMRHIKLSRFSGERTDRGSYRHNAGQISVSGVEGDYDAGTMTPEEAAERLRREQVAAVVYTTPSHQKDGKGQRWRVLCPFSQEMNPAERQKMVARLNGVLGGVLSAESFTASQSFAFGSVSGQPVPAVEFVEGRYLDQCKC